MSLRKYYHIENHIKTLRIAKMSMNSKTRVLTPLLLSVKSLPHYQIAQRIWDKNPGVHRIKNYHEGRSFA